LVGVKMSTKERDLGLWVDRERRKRGKRWLSGCETENERERKIWIN